MTHFYISLVCQEVNIVWFLNQKCVKTRYYWKTFSSLGKISPAIMLDIRNSNFILLGTMGKIALTLLFSAVCANFLNSIASDTCP